MEAMKINSNGYPVEIIELENNDRMKFNEEDLKSILLRNGIKNIPLVSILRFEELITKVMQFILTGGHFDCGPF
jgi:hypothetical protein